MMELIAGVLLAMVGIGIVVDWAIETWRSWL